MILYQMVAHVKLQETPTIPTQNVILFMEEIAPTIHAYLVLSKITQNNWKAGLELEIQMQRGICEAPLERRY